MIFFVLASLGSGGAERVVSLLANKMSEHGHQIEIICLKFNDAYYQIDSRVKVTFAMQQTNNRFSEIFWLRNYIKKQKPDVVIPFTEGVYCFTIAALLGTGIPIIASERLDPAAMSLPRKILKRLLLPYVDWLVVQTESIKAYFPKSIQKKTSVIYNPVREEVFQNSIKDSRVQSLNAVNSVQGSMAETQGSNSTSVKSSKENRIISVARLYPQKNQKMMIEAFAKIADEFLDWQLVIFGEGPERKNLESLVSSLKLQDRVSLPGRTEHVIEELRKSKIFCLSSDYEGMSNSMIEAICMGLPVISTRVSGTEELIMDGENGYVVEKGDTERLFLRIRELIMNKEKRILLGEKSIPLAYKFRLDVIVGEWENLIERCKKV